MSCAVLGDEDWSLTTVSDHETVKPIATLASLQAELKTLKDENARLSNTLESISKLAKK